MKASSATVFADCGSVFVIPVMGCADVWDASSSSLGAKVVFISSTLPRKINARAECRSGRSFLSTYTYNITLVEWNILCENTWQAVDTEACQVLILVVMEYTL